MHCGGRSSIATKELRLLAVARTGLGCFGLFWAILGWWLPPFYTSSPTPTGRNGQWGKFMLMQKEPNFLSLIFLPPLSFMVSVNAKKDILFVFFPFFLQNQILLTSIKLVLLLPSFSV